jgi:hypothetical protein
LEVERTLDEKAVEKEREEGKKERVRGFNLKDPLTLPLSHISQLQAMIIHQVDPMILIL